jgi:hypothetical protein
MQRLVETLGYRPLFVTVSGAHLYGFPSADSDVDLRGCHQLPLGDILGLDLPTAPQRNGLQHLCRWGRMMVAVAGHGQPG